MGHPSDDIDIATDAPPQAVLDLFPQTILVGLAFGVVIVVLGGHQFEVSSFRRDLEYLNGRKPESIELSNPQEDALRRDFTINGMFYDPLEDKIYDYVQGIDDLRKGIIRSIGDPFERFFEDRLRMIRAIRFSSRFGFPIDLNTQEAIIENAETLFPAVAIERVWNELVKMSKYPRFEHAIIEMHRLGLLSVIFPTLKNAHLNDIRHYMRRFFPYFPKEAPPIVYMMDLFPHFTSSQLWDLCLYLRTSIKDAKLVKFIYEGNALLSHDQILKDVDWVNFYAHPDSKLCLELSASHLSEDEKLAFILKHQANQNRLAEHIQRAIQKKPVIQADLLKSHGIQEGKLMGVLLKTAEEIAIQHNLHHPEDVLPLLQKSVHWPESL